MQNILTVLRNVSMNLRRLLGVFSCVAKSYKINTINKSCFNIVHFIDIVNLLIL